MNLHRKTFSENAAPVNKIIREKIANQRSLLLTNLFDIIMRILSLVFKNFPYAITHAMVKHVIVETAGHIDHENRAD